MGVLRLNPIREHKARKFSNKISKKVSNGLNCKTGFSMKKRLFFWNYNIIGLKQRAN